MPGRAGFGWRLLERGGVLCRCEACGLNRLIEVDERSISIHIWLKEKKLSVCLFIFGWVIRRRVTVETCPCRERKREFGRAGQEREIRGGVSSRIEIVQVKQSTVRSLRHSIGMPGDLNRVSSDIC